MFKLTRIFDLAFCYEWERSECKLYLYIFMNKRLMMMHGRLFLFLVISFTFACEAQNRVRTERAVNFYYVDPANGNDDYPGTSKNAPWKSIPGTRMVNDQAWLRTAWGAITNSNKIQAGDVIELKAGTTFNSSIGGKVLINSEFYENGIFNKPIIIRVSSTWGEGHTQIDAQGINLSKYSAFISVESRNNVHLSGANESRLLQVKNIKGEGVWGISLWGTKDDKQKGIHLSYTEVSHSDYGGVTIGYSDNWLVSKARSHHNKSIGFDVGGINDQHADNGEYRDTEAFANGTKGSTDIAHGFGLYGATNITYRRCKAYANVRDGFDFGTVGNDKASNAMVIQSIAFDNGEDGFGVNGAYDAAGVDNTFTYIRSIAYNNNQTGWNIYGGADAFLYHVISHHNGSQKYFGGNFMIYSSIAESSVYTTSATIRNSVGFAPKRHVNIYSYDSGGIETRIDSDFNIFVPRVKDAESFSELPYGTMDSYGEPPSWIGKNDCIGMRCDPKFVRVDTTDFSHNDYHLAPDSPAIDAGMFLNIPPHSPLQIDNVDRLDTPDIGIYESSSNKRTAK
ncbi:MAG: hypothetical protein ABFS45_02500 [Pseudomonadota bacterium]